LTQPPTTCCGYRDCGNSYKETIPSTHTMRDDDHAAGNKTRLATGGHRDIDGRLPMTKNVAQAP